MRTGLFYGWELVEERRAVDVYGEVLEQVELADDLGFDSVLFGESHFATSSACASLVGKIVERYCVPTSGPWRFNSVGS